MGKIKLKMAYDQHEIESELTALQCKDVSLAIQSARDETDINHIVKRFGLTGQLPSEVAMPRYEDFDTVWDYHSAMNLVVESRQAFMRFPADVRARFGNDPAGMIMFMEDGRNLEEARRLGLAIPAPVLEPLPAKV